MDTCPPTPYERVIEYFGSPTILARKLNIAPQAVYQWGGKVPKSRAFEIEVITNGDFKALELTAVNSGDPDSISSVKEALS